MIIIPSFQKTSSDFRQIINLNNQQVRIRLIYKVRAHSFFMDFTDSDNNFLSGLKLVPNWPLLKNHKALLNFSGDLMVLKSNDSVEKNITYDNLNNGWSFVYLTEDELSSWRTINGL